MTKTNRCVLTLPWVAVCCCLLSLAACAVKKPDPPSKGPAPRPVYMIEFNEEGKRQNTEEFEQVISIGRKMRPLTYIYVVAHGWWNTHEEAIASYAEMKKYTSAVAYNNDLREPEYESLTFGVYWPSKDVIARRMKERAGRVGAAGVREVIARLQREFPQAGVHLVGHSFGCKLLLAAVTQGEPLPKPIDTVVLILPAISSRAFTTSEPAEDDYQQIEDPRRVRGPVGILYSKNDSMLANLYPAFIGGKAMGAVGIEGGTLKTARKRKFENGIWQIEASKYIRGHSDFKNEEVAWRIWDFILRR